MFRKIIAVSFFLLFPTEWALAYSDQTTHPVLTAEILDFAGGFGEEERGWIIEGSRTEDTAPRWINHFYDPISASGWTGAKAGDLDASILRSMASVGATEPLSALAWARGCNTQSAYFANGGNRTWDIALSYYSQGNLKEAYITLGHILHLLEDLSVPDHSRDDTHAQNLGGDEGSPYEQYTSKYGPESIKSLGIAAGLRKDGLSPAKLNSPEEYLGRMASYSNRYFFSKDTINDPRYPEPKIVFENNDFAYGKDESGILFPVAKIDFGKEAGIVKKTYSIKPSEGSRPILDSYFYRLSRQAVLNGAGIVELFKRQAADVKVNEEFNVDTRHTLAKIACKTGDIAGKFNAMGVISYFGHMANSAMGQIISAANSAGAYATGTARSIYLFFAGIFSSPPAQNPENEPIENIQIVKNSGDIIPQENGPGRPAVLSAKLNPPSPPKPTPPKATTTAPEPPKPAFLGIASTPAAEEPRKQLAPSFPPPPKPTAPTYVFIGGGSSAQTPPPQTPPSPATTTQSSTSTTSPSNGATILISEILFDAIGSDSGKEFVELYNPSDSSKDLSDYSLKYSTETSTTSHTLALIHSSASSTDSYTIPPRGFFLLGFGGYIPENYGDKTADISRSASIPNGEDSHGAPQKITLGLFDGSKQNIDSVSYDKNSIIAPGDSLERLAWNDACFSASGAGEFLGNGCSSGDNRFESRHAPLPQNSSSFPEPRAAPTAPAPANGATSVISYSPNTLKMNFSWGESLDFANSATGIVYKIFETSSSTPLLIATTTATSTQKDIGEVGRVYNYGIIAEDRDGFPSATTSATMEVEGFADKIFFYKLGPASTSTLIEIRYSSRPFIPQLLSNGFNWQGLMFYLNREPNPANGMIYSGKNYSPNDTVGVVYVTDKGPAIFGLNPEDSPGFGGGLRGFSFLLPYEDGRLVLSATNAASSSASDYVVLAYYDVINSGGIWGDPDLGLIATDARKAFLSERPPEQSPPTKPMDLSLAFDQPGMKLNLSWSTSTDADSPDSEITYEINYSTSTELSASNWSSAGKANSGSILLAFGNDYLIGVRAVDDFGNASAESTAAWSFPDTFAPADPVVGSFTSAYCNSGPQPVTPASDIKIESVEFSALCANGTCEPPNNFAIYDSTGNTILAQSDGSNYFGVSELKRVKDYFTGANSIVLSASSTYSVMPRSANGQCSVGGNEVQSRFVITGSRP